MVSFEQQWEAAIATQDATRPRSPFRHAVLLLAIALVLITVPTIALARATNSHPTVHRCTVAQTIHHGCVGGSRRATVMP
jgi:hypothetical protein